MEDYRNQTAAGSLRLGTFFSLVKTITIFANQTSWSVLLFHSSTIPIAKEPNYFLESLVLLLNFWSLYCAWVQLEGAETVLF
jgi:hypothetical protein